MVIMFEGGGQVMVHRQVISVAMKLRHATFKTVEYQFYVKRQVEHRVLESRCNQKSSSDLLKIRTKADLVINLIVGLIVDLVVGSIVDLVISLSINLIISSIVDLVVGLSIDLVISSIVDLIVGLSIDLIIDLIVGLSIDLVIGLAVDLHDKKAHHSNAWQQQQSYVKA